MPVTVKTKSLPTRERRGNFSTTYYYTKSNGSVSAQTSGSYADVLAKFTFKSGSVDSEFVKNKKAGKFLPEYPFQFQQTEQTSAMSWDGLENPPSNLYVRSSVVTRYDWQPDTVPTFWVEPGWTNANSVGIRFRLQEKVRGAQVNVPVFLAEASKTASMVYARATQMARIVIALRRGRFKEAHSLLVSGSGSLTHKQERRLKRDFGKDPTKTASNTWLEWAYGWTPFMSEVDSSFKLVEELAARDETKMCRVRATERFESETVSYSTPASPLASLNGKVFDGSIYTKVSQTERQRWLVKINPLDVPAKLGLSNPLMVAWELVPFSFVADWFLPIGDYLAQLDMPLRFQHVSRVQGLREERTIVRQGKPRLASGYLSSTPSGAISSSWKRVTVRRSGDLGSPYVGVNELAASFDVGGRRAISAIALLRQQLSRLR